ncbi:uncharacterized protein METZ01_LOCUS60313, partial [marine metagenome]
QPMPGQLPCLSRVWLGRLRLASWVRVPDRFSCCRMAILDFERSTTVF